jgi:hypothetical protein
MECVKGTAVQAVEARQQVKKLRFSIDLSAHPFITLLVLVVVEIKLFKLGLQLFPSPQAAYS